MTDSESKDIGGYRFDSQEASHTQKYLWQPIREILARQRIDRLFDVGCGNGAFAFELARQGIDVTGVDPSEDGIRLANTHQADLTSDLQSPKLYQASAYDDLAGRFGTFPCVVSLEVVEHVYFPRKFAACIHDLLEPNGLAIISTPYHSYLKNLALALSGKMDQHFTALWDHGHIKFWSVKTLTQLFGEFGLMPEQILRTGRVPWLAKSMILTFRKQAK